MRWRVFYFCFYVLLWGVCSDKLALPKKKKIKKIYKKVDMTQGVQNEAQSTRLRRRKDDFFDDQVNGITVDLMNRENDMWSRVFGLARSLDYEIGVFYHVSAWAPYWEEIIEEQLRIVSGSRQFGNKAKPEPLPWSQDQYPALLKDAGEFLINIVGNDNSDYDRIRNFILSLKLKDISRAVFQFNKTITRTEYADASPERKKALEAIPEISEGEVSTVQKLHDYCIRQQRAGRRAVAVYFHNKGACCTRASKDPGEAAVASWREEMNTFTLMFPSICLRALQFGFVTCGTDLQDGHFSGNYWWADCHHVSLLPQLWNRFDAYAVEYFPMNISLHIDNSWSFAENCAYSPFQCKNINHYDTECPFSMYREVLERFLNHAVLPPNAAATVRGSSNRRWLERNCLSMKFNGPYAKQRFWNRTDDFHIRPNGGG